MGIDACDYVMDITHLYYLTYEIASRNFLRNWKKGCNKCQFCSDKPWRCSKMVKLNIIFINFNEKIINTIETETFTV